MFLEEFCFNGAIWYGSRSDVFCGDEQPISNKKVIKKEGALKNSFFMFNNQTNSNKGYKKVSSKARRNVKKSGKLNVKNFQPHLDSRNKENVFAFE